METNKLKNYIFPKDKNTLSEYETRIMIWVFLFELGAAIMEAAGGLISGIILILVMLVVPFAVAYLYRFIANRINK